MRFTFLVASLLHVFARAEPRCFSTEGIAVTDGSFVACNSSATVSACCATNKAKPDICIQGGLCYATEGSYSGYIYGNGCTDSTFDDEACPYACPMARTNGWRAYNVLPCVLDQWCCREASDRTNCCNNAAMLLDANHTSYLGKFIDNVAPGTSPTSSDSGATVTVTSTITATSSSGSDSSNTTTVVGAAVGVVLGVACIIALAGMFWMMKKVKSLKREMQSLKQLDDSYSNSTTALSTQHPYHALQNSGPTVHAYEADWSNGRYEIDGTSK